MGSLYDSLLDSILGCNQLMIRQSLFLLVMPMFITLSSGSQSLLLFGFCNLLSGCEQLVRGPTHVGANRLDLEMTDVPDIVDVVIGYYTRHFR